MELIQETLKGKDNLDMFISKRNRKNPELIKIEDSKGEYLNFKKPSTKSGVLFLHFRCLTILMKELSLSLEEVVISK